MLARPGKTYGSLRLTAGAWLVSGLPPHVSLRFKSMFSRVSKTSARDFRLVNTPEVCSDLLWFMDRYPLLVDLDTRIALETGHKAQLDRQEFVDRVLTADWQPSALPVFRPNRHPYPFQAQAAEIATRMGALLVMDDVGMGKTITALAAIARSGALPAAIVVPAHLADQWVEDYIEPFTTFTFHVIKGTRPYDLPTADIYVFKYSNIAGWVDVAKTSLFRTVVFDEMQDLRRGRGTDKGAAAEHFARAASLRLGLTATPVYNYGSEIFNLVDLLSPGALGSWSEFALEWCVMSGQHWLVKDPQALGAWLREASIAIRRVEGDVGAQMPAANVLTHAVPYDEDAAAATEAEARLLALKVLKGSFTERGQAARELDMMARHNTGVAKARGVAALVRMLAADGPVLVGGWHRDVYDIWASELADLNPVMYTGSETPKAKRAAKQAFVGGDSRVMFISLRSGSGLDGLQDVCRTVLIGELDWSPMVHRQLIGRLRRPGQKHQVDAIYAIADGGSDPVIVELLGLKSAQATGITDPFAPVQQTVSDDSRIRKLALAYLGRRDVEPKR